VLEEEASVDGFDPIKLGGIDNGRAVVNGHALGDHLHH